MKKSPRLKVGLVFDDSLDSSDGVSQYVKTLGAWLSSQGHEVRYLVGETSLSSWSGGRVYSLAKNLGVRFNGNKLSIPMPANKRRIKDVLMSEQFDVLHVQTPYSPFLAQRVLKQAAESTVVIGTFHIFPSGVLAKIGGRLLRIWYGKSLRQFRQIVSVSPAAQSYAKEVFKINSSVVPNPVDISKFSGASTSAKNDSRIVFLGRLVKRKGCSELIEAFYELTKRLTDAQLIIAGDGPQRKQLERKCRRLGISDKVTFLGFVAEAKKPAVLGSAAIACFPSLYGESFGIVLIESMAAGARVVLGGDNPGYRSVLGEQPKLLVNPRDKAVFAGRLEELLSNQPTIDGLQRWLKAEVKQYDIGIVGQQILDLYNGQIAQAAKNSHNGGHGL